LSSEARTQLGSQIHPGPYFPKLGDFALSKLFMLMIFSLSKIFYSHLCVIPDTCVERQQEWHSWPGFAVDCRMLARKKRGEHVADMFQGQQSYAHKAPCSLVALVWESILRGIFGVDVFDGVTSISIPFCPPQEMKLQTDSQRYH
jgi:hypothetical protein